MLNEKLSPSVVIGFDYGLKRIGVAIGNAVTKESRPLKIIPWKTNEEKWREVQKLIKEWEPDGFIVGVPCHSDGRENTMTKPCKTFGRQLKGRFNKPVYFVDERFSSVEAEATHPESEFIDDEAASVILQQWYLSDISSENS